MEPFLWSKRSAAFVPLSRVETVWRWKPSVYQPVPHPLRFFACKPPLVKDTKASNTHARACHTSRGSVPVSGCSVVGDALIFTLCARVCGGFEHIRTSPRCRLMHPFVLAWLRRSPVAGGSASRSRQTERFPVTKVSNPGEPRKCWMRAVAVLRIINRNWHQFFGCPARSVRSQCSLVSRKPKWETDSTRYLNRNTPVHPGWSGPCTEPRVPAGFARCVDGFW